MVTPAQIKDVPALLIDVPGFQVRGSLGSTLRDELARTGFTAHPDRSRGPLPIAHGWTYLALRDRIRVDRDQASGPVSTVIDQVLVRPSWFDRVRGRDNPIVVVFGDFEWSDMPPRDERDLRRRVDVRVKRRETLSAAVIRGTSFDTSSDRFTANPYAPDVYSAHRFTHELKVLDSGFLQTPAGKAVVRQTELFDARVRANCAGDPPRFDDEITSEVLDAIKAEVARLDDAVQETLAKMNPRTGVRMIGDLAQDVAQAPRGWFAREIGVGKLAWIAMVAGGGTAVPGGYLVRYVERATQWIATTSMCEGAEIRSPHVETPDDAEGIVLAALQRASRIQFRWNSMMVARSILETGMPDGEGARIADALEQYIDLLDSGALDANPRPLSGPLRRFAGVCSIAAGARHSVRFEDLFASIEPTLFPFVRFEDGFAPAALSTLMFDLHLTAHWFLKATLGEKPAADAVETVCQRLLEGACGPDFETLPRGTHVDESGRDIDFGALSSTHLIIGEAKARTQRNNPRGVVSAFTTQISQDPEKPVENAKTIAIEQVEFRLDHLKAGKPFLVAGSDQKVYAEGRELVGIVVSLHDYGGLTKAVPPSQWSTRVATTSDVPVIELGDFAVLAWTLKDGVELAHYLRFRQGLLRHGVQFSDEIDMLAAYLDDGEFSPHLPESQNPAALRIPQLRQRVASNDVTNAQVPPLDHTRWRRTIAKLQRLPSPLD